MSNNEVTYQDIVNAANKLSNAIINGSQQSLATINRWAGEPYFAAFEKNYDLYQQVQAERGYLCPFDLSGVLFSYIDGQLESLNVLSEFMNLYFLPYANLMINNKSLVSQASYEYFENSFMKPESVGPLTFYTQMVTLSSFADPNAPCPVMLKEPKDGLGLWWAIFYLNGLTTWAPSNKYFNALAGVSSHLQPADDVSLSAESESSGLKDAQVTFQDIQNAADYFNSYIKGDNFSFIGDVFNDWSGGFYMENCGYQDQGYEVTHVIIDIIGILNDYFLPLYNLVLNNQELISKESLYNWDYYFNFATIPTGRWNGETYVGGYISFIDMLSELNQFNSITEYECPNIDNSSLGSAVIPLVNIFDEWYVGAALYYDIFKNISTMLKPAASDTYNNEDGVTDSDIFDQAKALSIAAADPELSVLNNWTGMSILNFAFNYNLYINDNNSPAYISIKDILNAMNQFYLSVGKLIISIDSQINNPIVAGYSREWWGTNFGYPNLIGNSTSSNTIVNFAWTIQQYRSGVLTPEPIQPGDDFWNILLVFYYFTPWDDSNPIRQLMIDATNHIKPA